MSSTGHLIVVSHGWNNDMDDARALYRKLIDLKEDVGLATVYRVLTQFEAAGLAKSTALQSALVAPLVFSDRFIGTLAVYSTQPDFYTDDHRRLLDRVCEQGAAVIQNAVLFEQTQEDSLTDPLTSLPNTRSMFQRLARELARAERGGAEVALEVRALNDFKE